MCEQNFPEDINGSEDLISNNNSIPQSVEESWLGEDNFNFIRNYWYSVLFEMAEMRIWMLEKFEVLSW